MRKGDAATTRTVLLTTLLVLITALTGASLLIVERRLGQQLTTDFTAQLNLSAIAFRDAEAERLGALRREDDLLADLPSLKALLTTDDDRTIQDGALEFWRTSGNDLFALLGPDMRVRAMYARDLPAGSQFGHDLADAVRSAGHTYMLSSGHLFRYAVAPAYFGDAESGTLLGYVVNGYAIDTDYLTRISRQDEAQHVFLSNDVVLASSTVLPHTGAGTLLRRLSHVRAQPLLLDGERYLGTSRDLTPQSSAPLVLALFKSLRAPEREIRDIDRILLAVGLCVVLLGALGIVLVARQLTQPLEDLARRVRAFGSGGPRMRAPPRGTCEIRQLAEDFEHMQDRVEQSNRARLESERLATIGSMASSVSHDLRHYLASIYANAEFLASSDVSNRERAEFLDDIRTAVLGTTDMLESMMILGRTGQSVRHAPERLDVLARAAVAQVRTHPEAAATSIRFTAPEGDTTITADSKQLGRAIYNLLLNACQAARLGTEPAVVTVEIVPMTDAIAVRITDNGPGVAATVRTNLFEPFVSEGKQNGTGLGLTLTRSIAEEHDGSVRLLSSEPGATVFELRLPRIGGASEDARTMELQPGGVG